MANIFTRWTQAMRLTFGNLNKPLEELEAAINGIDTRIAQARSDLTAMNQLLNNKAEYRGCIQAADVLSVTGSGQLLIGDMHGEEAVKLGLENDWHYITVIGHSYNSAFKLVIATSFACITRKRVMRGGSWTHDWINMDQKYEDKRGKEIKASDYNNRGLVIELATPDQVGLPADFGIFVHLESTCPWIDLTGGVTQKIYGAGTGKMAIRSSDPHTGAWGAPRIL